MLCVFCNREMVDFLFLNWTMSSDRGLGVTLVGMFDPSQYFRHTWTRFDPSMIIDNYILCIVKR